MRSTWGPPLASGLCALAIAVVPACSRRTSEIKPELASADCLPRAWLKEKPNATKRATVEQLLAARHGAVASITLDPRKAGVVVPSTFAHQPHVTLEIGNDMPTPIPDLVVDDFGVSGTLSFSRKPHAVRVPWGAIFAAIGEETRGNVFPIDIPPDALCPR